MRTEIESIAFWFFAYRYGLVAIQLRECEKNIEYKTVNKIYYLLNLFLALLIVGNQIFILSIVLTNSGIHASTVFQTLNILVIPIFCQFADILILICALISVCHSLRHQPKMRISEPYMILHIITLTAQATAFIQITTLSVEI